jgi:acyl dehydratase
MPIMLKGLDGIRAHAGFTLGKSQWICVTDEMSTAFWLAIDEQEGGAVPRNGNGNRLRGEQVAHGFHALGLLIPLLEDVFLLEDVVVGQNYALREVRFLASVPINSSVRLSVKLDSVEYNHEHILLLLDCSMECDATKNPVLFAKLCLQCESAKSRALSLPTEHSHLQSQQGV